MQSPFKNDPFSIVYDSFKQLYPNRSCVIFWEYEPRIRDADVEVMGYTDFPPDGSEPTVHVSEKFSVTESVETLAHEMAHVAVGPDHEHDNVWADAYKQIRDGYLQRRERFNDLNRI